MHQMIALWTHPRSISTAFERIFVERDDHSVFHEPFAYVYFVHEQREQIEYASEADHPRTYEGVRQMLVDEAATRPVFHKDMCYHCDMLLRDDPAFLGSQVNTFLIRNPWRSVPSHDKVRPGFSLNAVGYEALYDTYRTVVNLGLPAVVIDADDLLARPHAVISAYCEAANIEFDERWLSWNPGLIDLWQTWPGWHDEVSSSTGLHASSTQRDIENVRDPKLRAYIRHSIPFYKAMYDNRLIPQLKDAA